jgi:predicted membrane metal-binding protein
MTSFAVVGRWLRRPQAGLHQLTLVALALLVLFPLWLFDLGFQLSVVSLAGIMLWTPKDVGSRAAAWWTSWAAQMATIPLTVVVFHQFSWVFLVSNAVAGPLFEILLGVWIVQGMVEWVLFTATPLGALEGVWRGWELHWAHWIDGAVAFLVHWGLHPTSASEGLFPSEVQQFIALGLALGAAWTVWRVSGVGRWVLAAAWVPVWFFWTLSLHELPAAHAVVYRTTYSWVLEVCTPDTAWSYATSNQYRNDFFWSVETAPVRQRLRGSGEPGGQVPVWNESLEECIRKLPDWDSTHCYQQWTWKNGEWKKVGFLSDA